MDKEKGADECQTPSSNLNANGLCFIFGKTKKNHFNASQFQVLVKSRYVF